MSFTKNNSFHKKYALLTIILCLILPFLALFGYLIPDFSSYPKRTSDNDKWIVIFVSALAMIISVVPTAASLIGFHIYGATGSTRVSKNIFGLLIFSLTLSVAIFSISFFIDLSSVFDSLFTNTHPRHYQLTSLLFLTNTFTQIFVFPILFTFLALSAKTVSLRKRLLPLISLVSSFLIPILLGIIIFYTYEYLGTFGQKIHQIATEATIFHWFMIGSIAWTLFGFSVLRESSKISIRNK